MIVVAAANSVSDNDSFLVNGDANSARINMILIVPSCATRGDSVEAVSHSIGERVTAVRVR
jgi:hypothetical protein